MQFVCKQISKTGKQEMIFQQFSRVIEWIDSRIIYFKSKLEIGKTDRKSTGTNFYYYPKENIIIRFDSAEHLMWEKRHRNQANLYQDDLL